MSRTVSFNAWVHFVNVGIEGAMICTVGLSMEAMCSLLAAAELMSV